MLLKIIKYDFKTVLKNLVPVWLIMIIFGIVSGFSLYFFDKSLALSSFSFVPLSLTLLTGLSYLCISLLSTVALVMCVSRFYSTLCTDVAYLNYTLPVTPKTQMMTRYWLSNILFFITSFIVVFSICIGLSISGVMSLTSIKNLFRIIISNMNNFQVILIAVLGFLSFITYSMSYIAKIYLSIAFGNTLAKKNKLIFVILTAFVVFTAESIIGQFIYIACISLNSSVATINLYYILLSALIIYNIATAVLSLFLTNKSISRNLNLS